MFARRRDRLTTYYSKNTSTRYLNLLKASACKVAKPVLRGLWGWAGERLQSWSQSEIPTNLISLHDKVFQLLKHHPQNPQPSPPSVHITRLFLSLPLVHCSGPAPLMRHLACDCGPLPLPVSVRSSSACCSWNFQTLGWRNYCLKKLRTVSMEDVIYI